MAEVGFPASHPSCEGRPEYRVALTWNLTAPALDRTLAAMSVSTGYRYIVITPEVRGGHARIEGTRIGVHDVVAYFLLGSEVGEIQERFPDLTRAQIYECLAYYEDHKAEIERLALEQMEPPAHEVLPGS